MLQEISKPAVLALSGLAISVVYLFGLAIYRLYLSPLAKFPGPRIVALTGWYEAYYDIVLKGKFQFEIAKWHDKYGPIIRIAPDEIHVRDSDYWDEAFSKNPKVDRYDAEEKRFGNFNSVFSTVSAAVWRRRRAALNPMFSRQQVLKLEPLIKSKVDIFCKQLKKHYDTGRPVRFDHAFAAFAGDVIVEYAFGFCYNQLESPGFSFSFHDAYMQSGEFGNLAVQFPIVHAAQSLPDKWVVKMNPALGSLYKLRSDLAKIYDDLVNGTANFINEKDKQKTTVFSEVLSSKLPAEDKSCRRIVDEGQAVIAGGVITTAWACCQFAYYVVSKPDVHKQLLEELTTVWPDSSQDIDTLTLEKLPYLRGCIQEALRLSYGVSHRQTRVHNDRTLRYGDWIIPAGTPIAMSLLDVHHDESIYPNSTEFIPERWMNGAKAPNGKPLDHYFLTFGKGTRLCLGINLAYQELFLMLATLFRRFEFELFKTDASDLKLEHDFFMPNPKLDTNGVRMNVTKTYT